MTPTSSSKVCFGTALLHTRRFLGTKKLLCNDALRIGSVVIVVAVNEPDVLKMKLDEAFILEGVDERKILCDDGAVEVVEHHTLRTAMG